VDLSFTFRVNLQPVGRARLHDHSYERLRAVLNWQLPNYAHTDAAHITLIESLDQWTRSFDHATGSASSVPSEHHLGPRTRTRDVRAFQSRSHGLDTWVYGALTASLPFVVPMARQTNVSMLFE
jgi:hypothetical protein